MEHKYSVRPLKAEDADRMLEWMRNENVTRFLKIGGADTTLEQVLRFIESAADESINLHRAVVDENDVYYGTVSLKNIDRVRKEAEYAIAMHMDGIGSGAAKAGSEELFSIAFNEEKLDRVYLYVNAANERAIRFYKKNGWLRMETESQDNNYIWFEKKIKKSK